MVLVSDRGVLCVTGEVGVALLVLSYCFVSHPEYMDLDGRRLVLDRVHNALEGERAKSVLNRYSATVPQTFLCTLRKGLCVGRSNGIRGIAKGGEQFALTR